MHYQQTLVTDFNIFHRTDEQYLQTTGISPKYLKSTHYTLAYFVIFEHASKQSASVKQIPFHQPPFHGDKKSFMFVLQISE